MGFVWEKCIITDGNVPEFPLDFLIPETTYPPIYYWNNVTKDREELESLGCSVIVPTSKMDPSEIEKAKFSMLFCLKKTRRMQLIEVVDGDETGLVIFS